MLLTTPGFGEDMAEGLPFLQKDSGPRAIRGASNPTTRCLRRVGRGKKVRSKNKFLSWAGLRWESQKCLRLFSVLRAYWSPKNAPRILHIISGSRCPKKPGEPSILLSRLKVLFSAISEKLFKEQIFFFFFFFCSQL